MRRRALLTSMAVGTAGLAGCVSSIVDDDGNGSDDGSGETVNSDSRFAGRDVPPMPDRGGGEDEERPTIQWYHESDESTRTYLEPATEHLELDGEIDFELVNDASESVRCGHWNCYKLVEGEWFHLAPRGHTDDCRTIEPGGRMTWTLQAFDGHCDCDDTGSCADGVTRGYLGPGVYAVVAGYGHPEDESGALVELDADPVSVEPTGGASIERDGAEVVVTTDRYGDGDHPPDATLIVERAGQDGGSGDADEPNRVVAEQLMDSGSGLGRYGALRDGIAAFDDDVERVSVRSDEHGVDFAIDRNPSTRRVEFRGTVYELTAEFEEQ